MKTTEAAKGRWDEILPHYNLQFTGKRHIKCPLCERKGSSGMRINEYQGDCSYICVCGTGSGFSLLMEMTGKAFAEIAKEIDRIIGNVSKQIKQPLPKSQKKVLDELQPINGTWSEYYLKSRGILGLPTMSVNHCSSVPYYDQDGKKVANYEAMVSTVTDAKTLEPLQLHYTYLDGSKKIDRKVRNLTDIDFKMPVVRLMDAEKSLGVAEGIETALSAHDKYNIPCWATVNSLFLKRFRAPAGVTKLFIFADNDKSLTGHAAAFECARANLTAKNDVVEVVIAWPDELGDFNDLDDKDNICMWESTRIN